MKGKMKVKKLKDINCFDFDLEIPLHKEGFVKKQFCLNEEETRRLMNNIRAALDT